MSVTTLNLAAGFHSDVCKLLEKFSEAPEIRMNEFTKIWRKMEFLKIFMYREGRELILFTEECFRILLRLILSEQPLQIRVGAFFCLYSVYVMQPSKPKVKIRLVIDAWKGFHSLIEESQLEPWENELKFAFWTLTYQKAFFYVAKENSTGLVTIASEGEGLINSNFNSAMEDYISSDHQNLKDLHARYMDIKDTLMSCSTKISQLVEKDLLSSVERDLEALKRKFNITNDISTNQNEENSQSDCDITEESDDEGDDEDTLERRQKVRSKQQALHVQQSKSRRHRETEAPEVNKKKIPKGRGRPRKTATVAKKLKEEVKGHERPFQDLDMSVDDEN